MKAFVYINRVCWLYVVALASLSSAFADTAGDSSSVRVTYDSTAITMRHFESAAIDAFRADPDFQYEEGGLDLSWWKRFKQWLRYKWYEIISSDGKFSLLDGALIVLGVAALCYLVLKLLGMDAANLFSRTAAKPPLDFLAHPENIHGVDFKQALQLAIDAGNYRLGVRLLYLDCLKKLSDFGLIDWKPAKTNATYAQELAEPDTRDAFRSLTRQFEYIWYGDFGINEHHFAQLREAFRQFDDRLR